MLPHRDSMRPHPAHNLARGVLQAFNAQAEPGHAGSGDQSLAGTRIHRGHLINTPDDVASTTWARLEDALANTHQTLWDRWHGSWRFRIAERKELRAELEAAQAERAAPGSVADVRRAESCWRLLRSAATVALSEYEKQSAQLAPKGPAGPDDTVLIALCDRLLDVVVRQNAPAHGEAHDGGRGPDGRPDGRLV
jgi:hypothetical protein